MTLVPNAQCISEFYGGFHGTCTQTSAAVLLASALGTPTDKQGVIDTMLSMTHDMIAKGIADPNGAATIYGMAEELRSRGVNIVTQWNYQEPLQEDWETLCNDNGGVRPILLQVARAYNAVDINGVHHNQGVQYHAICIIGKEVAGYIVADPNIYPGEEAPVIYTWDTLRNMVPCGLIMAEVTHSAPPTVTPPPAPQPTSTGDVVVHSGDTLSGIAMAHHDSLQAVENDNPQIANPNLIYPAEVVHLQSQEQQAAPPPPPPAQPRTYKVVSGDELWKIANDYNTTVDAIAQANHIQNVNLIYPGQVLVIPD